MTVEERLAESEANLDEFDRTAGLPEFGLGRTETEAQRLLGLPPSLVGKLTADDCGNGAYCLRQFAWHLQRAVNRLNAQLHWAEENVRKVIAPKLRQTSGPSYEERKLLAIRGDDAATKLEGIRVSAQLKLDRISFLSARAGELAMTLDRMQQTRHRRETERG